MVEAKRSKSVMEALIYCNNGNMQLVGVNMISSLIFQERFCLLTIATQYYRFMMSILCLFMRCVELLVGFSLDFVITVFL